MDSVDLDYLAYDCVVISIAIGILSLSFMGVMYILDYVGVI